MFVVVFWGLGMEVSCGGSVGAVCCLSFGGVGCVCTGGCVFSSGLELWLEYVVFCVVLDVVVLV